VLVAGTLFIKAYPHIGPATTFTPQELVIQEKLAHAPGATAAVSGFKDASTTEHWQELKQGVSTVIHHPQGFGLGNAGTSAARTGVTIKAGESTYTELGVDTSLLGVLLFAAWSLSLAWSALRCTVWVGAALLAMLALGVQTDIIGVPWVAFNVWTLAGSQVARVGERRAQRLRRRAYV
jgi:hypothetical protein